MALSLDNLRIDPPASISQIADAIREQVFKRLRRRGAVVGVSGGVDSAVCLALSVCALGKERVLALQSPERDSSPDSTRLGRLLAEKLGVETFLEDITPMLEAAGTYRRQREAIRQVFPEFEEGWKFKVVLPSILDADRLNISRLCIEKRPGESSTNRLSSSAYLQLIAATNFKQRTRKMLEYYHADRMNYAVCGTPNRLEYDQGFFVKGGDGAADFKPIAHLYKTQVYQLARSLGVPEEICDRKPTTDTFPLAQTQEEFYFALPYEKMDLCLYAHNRGLSTGELSNATGLTVEQIQRVFKDIEAKRRATLPFHVPPLLVEEVGEVSSAVEALKTSGGKAV